MLFREERIYDSLFPSDLVPDLCQIVQRQNGKVGLQCACVYSLFVFVCVHGSAKQNIILDRQILDPRLLGHITYRALGGNYKQL